MGYKAVSKPEVLMVEEFQYGGLIGGYDFKSTIFFNNHHKTYLFEVTSLFLGFSSTRNPFLPLLKPLDADHVTHIQDGGQFWRQN